MEKKNHGDDQSESIVQLREQNEDAIPFGPKSFEEYLGQAMVKEKLELYVQASKLRRDTLDHILIFGPAGLGKTTLARVIGHELDVGIKITSAPALERSGDLVALLSNLGEREILFIDEIHRLAKPIEEVLYSAMEEFCVDMILGQGPGARSVRLPLNKFTLIGATTRASLLSAPLQTRFGIVERLDFYTQEELALIVLQTARYLQIAVDEDAAALIGRRARGTPRIAKRIVRRVRDFAQVRSVTSVTKDLADEALSFLGIDHDGLTKLDRDILTVILKDFNGGPVGLETLAAVTGEDKETIEEYCEPFLLREGFLQKTPRGRQIAPSKFKQLKSRFLNEVVEQEQISLFEE